MPDYPIISTSSLVLDIYNADQGLTATSLPASLDTAVQDFQTFRNSIANVQDECDTFCTPSLIYQLWKLGTFTGGASPL